MPASFWKCCWPAAPPRSTSHGRVRSPLAVVVVVVVLLLLLLLLLHLLGSGSGVHLCCRPRRVRLASVRHGCAPSYDGRARA